MSILHEVSNPHLPVTSDSSELISLHCTICESPFLAARTTDLLGLPQMIDDYCTDMWGNKKIEDPISGVKQDS